MPEQPVLVGRNLVKRFPVKHHRGKFVHALEDVDFEIAAGETLGLVGESGCGKSTLARTAIRVYEPDAGELFLSGHDITHLSIRDLRPHRRTIQMVFQDPFSSLNPRLSVRDIVAEPLIAHGLAATRKDRDDLVKAMLERVGLPAEHASRYPHEFSGGQRQRIGIARALMLNPSVLICDEPVSALDVSIQASVINLLRQLQDERRLAYLFIGHDLSMVRYVSDRIGVMYLGRIVEQTTADEIVREPLHPYTRALLASAPGSNRTTVDAVGGDVPSPIDPPSGCAFRTRCPVATKRCAAERPLLSDVGAGHLVACHLVPGGKEANPAP